MLVSHKSVQIEYFCTIGFGKVTDTSHDMVLVGCGLLQNSYDVNVTLPDGPRSHHSPSR